MMYVSTVTHHRNGPGEMTYWRCCEVKVKVNSVCCRYQTELLPRKTANVVNTDFLPSFLSHRLSKFRFEQGKVRRTVESAIQRSGK